MISILKPCGCKTIHNDISTLDSEFYNLGCLVFNTGNFIMCDSHKLKHTLAKKSRDERLLAKWKNRSSHEHVR